MNRPFRNINAGEIYIYSCISNYSTKHSTMSINNAKAVGEEEINSEGVVSVWALRKIGTESWRGFR